MVYIGPTICIGILTSLSLNTSPSDVVLPSSTAVSEECNSEFPVAFFTKYATRAETAALSFDSR